MKKAILVFSLTLIALSAFSRQFPNNENKNGIDTSLVLPFLSYNLLNKQRLDSIERSIPLPYNEFVQLAIEKYSRRKVEIGKMVGLSEYYFPIFERALASFGVPDEMKYLPIVESSLDPFAISKSGAIGLWQFMAGTAKGYKLEINDFEDERRDPTKASFAAAAYLRDAYNEFGDWLLALAAYNCGSTTVNKAIAKVGSRNYWDIRPLLPLQGRNYIPAFIAAVYSMNFVDNNQIKPQQYNWLPTDTIFVNKSLPFSTLANAIGTDAETLEFLNPLFRKRVINGSNELLKKVVIPKVPAEFYPALYDMLNFPSGADAQTMRQPPLKYNKTKVKSEKLSITSLVRNKSNEKT